MKNSLSERKCVPCEVGTPALSDEEIEIYMSQLPEWEVRAIDRDGKPVKAIQRQFQFKDFVTAMDFLKKVAVISEAEKHHPDFCVHYSKVDITIWTHAVKGLHENDFILASKINEASVRYK